MHRFTTDWINGYDQNIKHINEYLPKNFNYLEIGVFEARSFCYVLENLEPRLAIGVDHYKDFYYGFNQTLSHENALKNINLSVKNTVWNLYKTDSDSFFNNDIHKYDITSFDLVYIDGSHEYDCVKKDVENVFHLIKPKVIILDDYLISSVMKAIIDISELLQTEYILEAVNTQYVLVRRDCYSKKL